MNLINLGQFCEPSMSLWSHLTPRSYRSLVSTFLQCEENQRWSNMACVSRQSPEFLLYWLNEIHVFRNAA